MAVASSFRRMTMQDRAAVLGIEEASFPCPWKWGAFRTALKERGTSAYVCEVGGEVAAYLIFALEGEEAHVITLAVHPGRRRKGIATACLRFMEQLARRRGAVRVLLEVGESNLAAQLFYRKRGYRATRILRDHYPDEGEDGYQMVRRLIRRAQVAP